MALKKASYGINKLKDGKGYSVRPWVTNPYTNKKEQLFKQSTKWTKKDAERQVEDMIKNPKKYFKPQNSVGPVMVQNNIVGKLTMNSTVEALFDSYIEYASLRKAASTIENYKLNYRKHLHDFLGHYTLSELDVSIITDWLNKLLSYKKDNGDFSGNGAGKYRLRNSSLTNIIVILKNMIKYGNTMRKLNIEVEVECELGKEQEKEIPFWNIDDRMKFFEVIKEGNNTRDKALFALYLVTGVRMGEGLALQPQHIDFKEKKVLIATSRGRFEDSTITKTGQSRRISLDNETLELLKDRIEELEKKIDYHPEKTFISSGVRPLSPTQLRRIFDSYKLKLKEKYPEVRTDVTLHGMRHSVAYAVSEDFGIEQAALRLGHKSLQTTKKYTHPKEKENVAESLSLTNKK